MKLGSIKTLRDSIVQSRWRLLATGIVGPALAALLLCALGSLWPIRLDYRSLQDLHKLEGLGLPQSSGRFLFLSRDNGIQSTHIVTFALRPLAFPSGSVDWGALKEACDQPQTASFFFGVDLNGQSYEARALASGGLSWIPNDGPRNLALADTREAYVIFDSQATRQEFEARWPFLKQAAHVSVLPDTRVKSVARRPFGSEFTFERVVRIAAVIGTLFAAFLVLIQLPFLSRAPTVISAAIATFLALGMNIWLAYLLGWISPALVQWAPSLLWLVGLLAALFFSPRALGWGPEQSRWQFSALSASGRLALTFCSLAYALLFLARLDFDGDFFNNWLPQGRFFYFLGRHDPSLIVQQGSMQAASYPPGYGILLSTVMWMIGMNPTASFLPGMDSSFAILIYRLLVLALNLSLFLLIAAYLKRLGAEKSALWIPALVILMLLIPTTAGKHIAAETILFPMLAASIVLIATGRRCSVDGLTALGLLVGGMATLVKWEAGLLFAVGVLPWLFPLTTSKAGRLSKSSIVVWPVVTALACLPALIWKATLPIHNEFFGSVDKARLLASAHQFAGLAGAAARMMLEDGRLILFLLVLPCALVFQFRVKPHWLAFLVPACIAALLIGWIVVFLFSNSPPLGLLETSYSRLIMIPTFSAILYCADALIDWSGAQVNTTLDLGAKI